MNAITRPLKKIFFSRPMAKLCLRPLMRLHNFSYKAIGRCSILLNDGTHIKHRIQDYKEWFLAQISAGDCVLDIGCNRGQMVELMATKAKKAYGIDIVPAHIEACKRKITKGNCQFFLGDAQTFPFDQYIQELHVVTLSNVLEHISQRPEFLKNLQKVLPHSSLLKFLIRVPMIDRDWLTPYKKQMGVEWRLDPTHYTEYTFEQFERELKEANMQLLHSQVRFGELYAICQVAK